MADVGFFQNHLKGLLTDPSSFEKTPGFQFALDTGLNAVNRSNSRMRGSGKALAELTKFGTGLANQEYGNQVDRMGRLLGQEQQFDLGQGQLQLGRDRLGLDRELGMGQLGLGRDRLALDDRLGTGQLQLGQDRLGLDRDLGFRRLDNDREGNYMNFILGADRNSLTASQQQNDFNLGNRRADIDWFNAQTGRGRAMSDDFWTGQQFRDRNRSPWV